MKTILLSILMAVALTATSGSAETVVTAAQMTESAAASAAPSVKNGISNPLISMPLQLTASDLVTKVYGVFDTGLSQSQTAEEVASRMKLTPSADRKSLWLDSADGYVVSYYGMMPQLSAVAYFNDQGVTNFCYFFIFPYSSGNRDTANLEQSLFAGSLLQEMNDVGLIIGMPDSTDAIFEAIGSYQDKHIDVRLLEEEELNESGRFILSLEVTPGSYSNYDYILADR